MTVTNRALLAVAAGFIGNSPLALMAKEARPRTAVPALKVLSSMSVAHLFRTGYPAESTPGPLARQVLAPKFSFDDKLGSNAPRRQNQGRC